MRISVGDVRPRTTSEDDMRRERSARTAPRRMVRDPRESGGRSSSGRVVAASRWAIVSRESARSHGGGRESVDRNYAFLGTTTNRLLWISEERFRRLCVRLVKIYEDLAQIYRRQEGYDNNRWIDGGERVSLYHRATRSQRALSIDRSFLFFPFVREARRGERRRCEARRSDAFRGLLDTAGRAAIHSLDPNSRASPARFFP